MSQLIVVQDFDVLPKPEGKAKSSYKVGDTVDSEKPPKGLDVVFYFRRGLLREVSE